MFRIIFYLSDPVSQSILIECPGHVIYQQDDIGAYVSVENTFEMVGTHRSIPFLSSAVPDLEPIGLIIYLFVNIFKINANSGICTVLELIID